jgi:hypothetical protein
MLTALTVPSLSWGSLSTRSALILFGTAIVGLVVGFGLAEWVALIWAALRRTRE